MEYYWLSVTFLLGLMVGSFVNVCAWRIPREESIIYPGSYCPECKHKLGFLDLFPVASYLFLGGRCRYCKARISARYPLVELITAVLFVSVYLRFGPTWQTIYYIAFAVMLWIVSLIDLKCRIIPDSISLPGIVLGLAVPWLYTGVFPWTRLIGAMVGGGILYIVALGSLWILKKEGMGGGDIKLLAMIGAFTGWQEVLAVLFLASFLGSIAGIWLFIWKKLSSDRSIPFGPFLATAAFIIALWGREIIAWFLQLYNMGV